MRSLRGSWLISGTGLEESTVFVKGDLAIRGMDRGKCCSNVIQPHPSLALSLLLWLPSTDIPLS